MQIQLHAAEKNLMLHNIGLILEILSKTTHNLIGIFYHLNVLSNNPDDGSFGFGIVKGF